MGKEIVLGLGNCVDFEVAWDSRTIERLAAEHRIEPRELDAERPISTLRNFVISLLGYLQAGSGGERFVPSPDILREVASRFETAITVGGTSLRAAIAMRRLGYESAVHLVAMNRHVRERLPEGCEWICSEAEEEIHPHLIFQFPAGARVRTGGLPISARKANRVIYVHDPQNESMKISPQLAELSSQARVFLVSGLNATRSSALLADRLEQLRAVLESLPADAAVFYEDAGFHDERLSRQVRDVLLDRIAIYSLNEDELQKHLGRRVSLLDPGDVLSALGELSRIIPAPALVVHTSHWVLARGTGADRFERSLRAGIAMACTRMRLGDEFGRRDVLNTESMPVRKEGAEFADAINAGGGGEVCCLPSIGIAGNPAATVGLGDAFVGGFLPMLLEGERSQGGP